MNLGLRHLSLLSCAAGALVLSGCSSVPAGPTSLQGTSFSGGVHGGQQPVSGAAIQLYAVGTSGYGSVARPLIASPVFSNGNGAFNITGTYTCQSTDLLYLVATGGNPGVSGSAVNSGLALMAGVGPCGSLTSSTFISVNELTTVASVWSLAPFMTGVTGVGTSSTNVQGLQNAFAGLATVVNNTTGTLPGPAFPAGATLPLSEINTLADILATCVNTVDTAAPQGRSAACQNLFSATATAGVAPTDTVGAALNLAQNPTLGLALVSSAPANAPFQPTLNGVAPSAWTISINYIGGGLSAPSAIAVDPAGNVFLTNAGNNSVTKLDSTGTAVSGATGFTAGSLNVPSSIAIDTAGNLWVGNRGNNTLSELSNSGLTGSAFSGGGLNLPGSLSIDSSGEIWAANSGASSVSEFSNSGVALSPASGYAATGPGHPVAIAIDPK